MEFEVEGFRVSSFGSIVEGLRVQGSIFGVTRLGLRV
jgi:hypothetical protein